MPQRACLCQFLALSEASIACQFPAQINLCKRDDPSFHHLITDSQAKLFRFVLQHLFERTRFSVTSKDRVQPLFFKCLSSDAIITLIKVLWFIIFSFFIVYFLLYAVLFALLSFLEQFFSPSMVVSVAKANVLFLLFAMKIERGFDAQFSPQTTGKKTLWHPGYTDAKGRYTPNRQLAITLYYIVSPFHIRI